MCIVFLALSAVPEKDGYKLIVAANRDESFDRPTKEAHFWDDNPDIIAGVDLSPGREGGTWLGMSKSGKVGILTNYRQNSSFANPDRKSRGHLVSCFLKSNDSPRTYIEKVKQSGKDYNGFNLIVGNVSATDSQFTCYCNQEDRPLEDLKVGVYGLSNRYLDYGWKKVTLGKEKFKKAIQTQCPVDKKIALLLEILQDQTRYPNDELFRGPQDDGVPNFVLEYMSATSVFLPSAAYGTRTNTVIFVDDKDNVTFVERTMEEPIDVQDIRWNTNTFTFKIRTALDNEFISSLL